MTRNQLQVVLTGIVGDGSISKSFYVTNCIHKEYIDFKAKLLGKLFSSQRESMNSGYKVAPIFHASSKSSPEIKQIKQNSLRKNLNLLDDLGIALWFYDDGSLHKKKHFYNLCTHAFTEQEHKIIIPFLEKRLKVKIMLRTEKKKDGRKFFYCSINKLDGAEKIAKLLAKYPVGCYKYKYEPITLRK